MGQTIIAKYKDNVARKSGNIQIILPDEIASKLQQKQIVIEIIKLNEERSTVFALNQTEDLNSVTFNNKLVIDYKDVFSKLLQNILD